MEDVGCGWWCIVFFFVLLEIIEYDIIVYLVC